MKKVVSIFLVTFACTLWGSQDIETAKITFKNTTPHFVPINVIAPLNPNSSSSFEVTPGREITKSLPIVILQIKSFGQVTELTSSDVRKLSGKTIELIKTSEGKIELNVPSEAADLAQCHQRIEELETVNARLKARLTEYEPGA